MELEALLAPLSAPSPCGEDMSFSVEFDQIAEMRREDDPTLDQGEWVTSLKVADWPGVVEACSSLLTSRTKDLRLAMWLTEAWAITRGYKGLSQGLALCTRLCERHWLGLHPLADGQDQEERIGNMGWLLQRVVSLADALPVTQSRQGVAFSLRDLASARQLQALAERAPDEAARQMPDKVSLEQFNRALRDTPPDSLLAILDAARQAQAHLLAWQQVIDGHLGADGPGFVQAKEALSQAIHEIDRLARDAGALSAGATASDSTAASPGPERDDSGLDQTSEAISKAGSPLRSRAQALAQLREVAVYFRRTEPHSPVAYLAEKAVKWGDMPLHEWLRQVVKDQGAMAHLQELLGVEAPGEGPGAY